MDDGNLPQDSDVKETFLHNTSNPPAHTVKEQYSEVTLEDVQKTNSDAGRKSRKECCKVIHQYRAAEWFLLLNAFVYNLLSGIEAASVSLLYVEYTVFFQISKAEAGWAASIRSACFSVFGGYRFHGCT